MRLRLVDRRSRRAAAGDPFVALAGRTDPAGELGRPDWTVNLVLVDDDEMTGLNEEYRHAEGVTDVLSFSYLQSEGAGEPDLAGGDRHACRDLWLDPFEEAGAAETVVGELVLAPGFVAGRCREKDWSLEHELPLLLVHGCLHVLGWTHDGERDRARMRNEEAGLLAAVGLPHPLGAVEAEPTGPADPESGTR